MGQRRRKSTNPTHLAKNLCCNLWGTFIAPRRDALRSCSSARTARRNSRPRGVSTPIAEWHISLESAESHARRNPFLLLRPTFGRSSRRARSAMRPRLQVKSMARLPPDSWPGCKRPCVPRRARRKVRPKRSIVARKGAERSRKGTRTRASGRETSPPQGDGSTRATAPARAYCGVCPSRRRCRSTCNRQSSASVRSSSIGMARPHRLQYRATVIPTASRSRRWSRVMLPLRPLRGIRQRGGGVGERDRKLRAAIRL